jgi:hypothetical protein
MRIVTGVIGGRREELIRARASGRGWRMVALEIMPDHGHIDAGLNAARNFATRAGLGSGQAPAA